MKIYTVLEVRHIGCDPVSHEFDELNGWSTSYLTKDEAFENLRDLVCDAVNIYYEGSGIEDSVKANLISEILKDMDGNKSETSWDSGYYHYIWKINEDEVDDPDPTTQAPARSENKDEPVKPKEAKIGFKLTDDVTGEVYSYMFREPQTAFEFAKGIRYVMEQISGVVGIFVWNPVKGERQTNQLPLTWENLINALEIAQVPERMLSREMKEQRDKTYPEFYPDNVWSILLKHTSTLVVNVKAKTLDEAIEKVKAKGETNDWFADPDVWSWDGDGEPVEVDRESCHAAPGEEEDF